MAANKVKFLTGANNDVNNVAKVAGQILFAVDSNNYGYIYYDKNNSTRVKMGESLTFAGDTILNINKNATTGVTEFKHTGHGLIFVVKGTQTSNTGNWTGELDDISSATEMYDGLSILYYLPRNGSGNASLKLTFADGSQSANIPVYCTSTTRCTTHYSAGSTIRLTYWSAGSISVNGTATTEPRWTANDYWDGNDITTQSQYYTNVTAGTHPIARYSIIMMDKDGKYQSIMYHSTTPASNSAAQGTTKVLNDAKFVLGQPIFYVNKSSETAKDAIVGNNVCRTHQGLIDFRYTFNCGTTLVKNSPMLLKGIVDSNGYWTPSGTGYSNTWPTTDDGFVYIYIGFTYTDTAGYRGDFWGGSCEAYVFKDGGLRSYVAIAERAVLADKATGDSGGRNIAGTYIDNITTDTANHKLTFTRPSGSSVNRALNFVRIAGDTMTGALLPVGKEHFIAYPSDGEYSSSSGTVTGYLKIRIPKTKSATMFSFDVDIYNYVANASVRYHIAGYNYNNASWNAITAYCIAPYNNSKANLKVRFLSNGDDEMYVCIGEPTTTWSYPKAYIHNITIGHSGASYANWASGWTITIDSTEFDSTLVKHTIDAPNINDTVGSLDWTKLTNVPTLVASAAGTTNASKYTVQLYSHTGAAIAASNNPTTNGVIDIPAATASIAGLITAGAQTFAGKKTFSSGIIAKTENDFISHSNEFNFAPALTANLEIHFNHRTAGTNTANTSITRYHFKNGNGAYSIVKAASFEGSLSWANLTNVPVIVRAGAGTTSTTNYVIQLYDLNGAIIAENTNATLNGKITIPAATASIAGLITTGTQTLAGVKTFSGGVTVSASGGFNYTGMQAGTSNADRIVWFSDSSAVGKPVYDNDFKYNPSTNTLKLGNITATGAFSANGLTLSGGDDSTHSTETATLKVTGGASISMNLSAKSIRIDNGVTTPDEGFKLIYNSTDKCLEFQFGN